MAALLLLFVVFELIRSRRLQERYALLWLLTGIVLLVLALWRGALGLLADAVGIAYPPSALFVLAALFILLLLLHYSTVISKLSDQNRILAQRPPCSRTNSRVSGAPGSRRRRSWSALTRSRNGSPGDYAGMTPESPGELELSIVLVNHNGAACLPATLHALAGGTETERVECLVVDSGSNDGSWEEVPRLWDRARALRFEQNIGFCAGCNRGAEAATGRCSLS